MRKAAEADPDYPPALFFFLAPVEAGKQLFEEYWPDASGVSDPERYFYQAFDRRRMRWWWRSPRGTRRIR